MPANLSAVALERNAAKDLFQTVSDIGPILSQYVEVEESERRLSRQVMNLLKEAGLLRLFLPKSLGGLETDPLTTAKLVEEISSYNTAAGWAMMVANTAAFWNSRLSDKGIEEIYANGPDTIMAGAFHPPMSATRTDGGFVINGKSPLTSNAHEADWFFVTAFVIENGQLKMNNGMPEVIGAIMKAKEIKIVDTWYTIGMKATDSNDICAEDVFVPLHRSFPLMPEFLRNSHFDGPLYRFPAIGASIASLITPVALAVARNSIKELKSLAEKKVPFASMVSIREKGSIQRKLGIAESLVQSSRAFLHQEISHCWNKTITGEKISLEERGSLLLAVTHTNQSCLQATELMYSAAGTSGIYTKNKLSHYFTDAQVIRHHGFSNESRYETAGQIYFGLQPDLAVILF
jgi:indole-3-acetate monooxygenase